MGFRGREWGCYGAYRSPWPSCGSCIGGRDLAKDCGLTCRPYVQPGPSNPNPTTNEARPKRVDDEGNEEGADDKDGEDEKGDEGEEFVVEDITDKFIKEDGEVTG